MRKHEIAGVRLLALKALAFAAPFALFGLAMVLVDPFDYFDALRFIDKSHKDETTLRLHDTLRKAIDFEHDPVPNLLLGDSLMNSLRPEMVEPVAKERYFNFSFGGGTIPEVVDAFWFAAEREKLKRVYIGVGFINFSTSQNMNRFPEAVAMLNSPLLYLTNRIVVKSAVFSVWAQLTGEDPRIGRVKGPKEAFWKRQIGESTTAIYRRFQYQPEFVDRLREVSKYCAANGVEVTFVILPTHTDLQEKLEQFELEATYARFKADMKSLGNVIDFNFPNAFTRSVDNFKDPYHVDDPSMVIDAIWGDSDAMEYVRRYPATSESGGRETK